MLEMSEKLQNNENKIAAEGTNMKIMKKMTNRCLLKLDYDAPSPADSQFSLFQIWLNCNAIGGQKPSKLTLAGACGSKKREEERFRRHVKHVTKKVPPSVTNMVQKECLKK